MRASAHFRSTTDQAEDALVYSKEPAVQLSRAELAMVLERAASHSIRPTASLMAFAYGGFSVAHMFTLAWPTSIVMAAIASATCLIGTVVWRMCSDTQPLPIRSHDVLGVLSLLILSNIAAHMAFLEDYLQTTYFALVMVACGFLMLDRVWFMVSIGAYLGTWATVAWRLPPSPNTGHFCYLMVVSSFIAIAVQIVRRRTTVRTETGRILSERETARAHARTLKMRQENEAFLTQILNSVPLAVYLRDHQGRFRLVNNALAELVGKSPEQLLRARPSDLWPAGDPISSLFQQDGEVLTGGAKHVTGDIQLAQDDCEPQHFIRTSTELLHHGYPSVLTVAVDISQRVQMEKNQKALIVAMQRTQKLESLGVLAAGVAHDFNNSLAAIVNFAELIAKGVPAESKEGQCASHILEAARQAMGTTKGLLTFGGQHASEKSAIDIGCLLRQTVAFMKNVVPASIDVSLRLPEAMSLICDIDETQFQQVLLNLGFNARDAMPDGGQITISVEPAPSRPGFVLLSVADNGMGMPDEVKERVFDPFFTTKGREQGTGLGMAIVHGIIDDHGGSIDLDSAVGRGTTVKILLPISRQAERECQPGETMDLDGRGTTILLAEDDANVRFAIVAQLEQAGFQVIEATDGQAALDIFERQGKSVQLLLLDVDLPKIDGAACLRKIRERAPSVPAILMSGTPLNAPEQEHAAFLCKPFGKASLLSTINDVWTCAGSCSDSGVCQRSLTTDPR